MIVIRTCRGFEELQALLCPLGKFFAGADFHFFVDEYVGMSECGSAEMVGIGIANDLLP